MQVTVIGSGYVGLTTGACLAHIGHEVACVDIDERRIEALTAGVVPIHEEGLDGLICQNVAAGLLRFSTDISASVRSADIVMIAVGTPKALAGGADLSQVEAAGRQIASAIRPKAVVAIKSTVPVGTARLLREIIAEERGGLDFWISSNPEFLREGRAVEDFLKPDRVVIGADDTEAAARLRELYRPLLDQDVPVVATSTVNAELIKYAANAFLALKIGFINDVADLCEAADGDVAAVARGIGLDHRIGPEFLQPGPGFGGSCFPKDTQAFVVAGRKFAAPQPLVEALVTRNEARKRNIAKRILAELNGRSNAKIALLGVAFKANTDDVRDSAALTIVPLLQAAGVSISAYDPKAQANGSQLLRAVTWRDCPYEACRDADLAVVLTEWDVFRALDLARLSKEMRDSIIFDCRNMMEPQEVANHGFRYVSLGRAPVPRTTAPRASKGGKTRECKTAAPNRI